MFALTCGGGGGGGGSSHSTVLSLMTHPILPTSPSPHKSTPPLKGRRGALKSEWPP